MDPVGRQLLSGWQVASFRNKLDMELALADLSPGASTATRHHDFAILFNEGINHGGVVPLCEGAGDDQPSAGGRAISRRVNQIRLEGLKCSHVYWDTRSPLFADRDRYLRQRLAPTTQEIGEEAYARSQKLLRAPDSMEVLGYCWTCVDIGGSTMLSQVFHYSW